MSDSDKRQIGLTPDRNLYDRIVAIAAISPFKVGLATIAIEAIRVGLPEIERRLRRGEPAQGRISAIVNDGEHCLHDSNGDLSV